VPCDLARKWLEAHGYRSSAFLGELPDARTPDRSIPAGAEQSPITTHVAPIAEALSDEVERPSKVSDGAWQIYLQAQRLNSDFDKKRGGIAEVARLIEAEPSNKKPWSSIYRDLMRVKKALQDQKKKSA